MMPDTQPKFTANYGGGDSFDAKKAVLVVVSVLVALVVWTYVTSPLITSVTGVGEVSVPASFATVSFTVAASGDNPQIAISGAKGKADALTDFLMEKGVAETDIAQGQIAAAPASLVTEGASGYQATITMAAKTGSVSEIDSLISEIYVNGASVVSQPVLSVDKAEDLEKTAYDMAVKDAKSKSWKVALSNWKLIRKVVALSETSSGSTSTATTKADALNSDEIAIQNGVFKIVKAVSITYKMW